MSGPEIVCHTVGSCELRGLKFSFSDKLLSLLKRSDLICSYAHSEMSSITL